MEVTAETEKQQEKKAKQPVRKRGRPKKKKVISQKRVVETVKVFMTREEKLDLQSKVGDFKSLSNYIRHHLGMGLNETGRKRKFTESALDLDFTTEE